MAEELKKKLTRKKTTTSSKKTTTSKPRKKTSKKQVNYEYEENTSRVLPGEEKNIEKTIDELIKIDIEDDDEPLVEEKETKKENEIEIEQDDDLENTALIFKRPTIIDKDKTEDIEILLNHDELEKANEERSILEAKKEYQRKKEHRRKTTKYRLNKKGIFMIVILIVLVDALFISLLVNMSNKNNNDKKDEITIEKPKTDNKKDETKKEEKKEEKKEDSTSKDRNQYDKYKLAELNNIDTTISFFKYENLDRYVAFKEAHEDDDFTDEMVVVYVNIGLDKAYYTDIKNSPNTDNNKVLVNKYYSLGSDFEPSNLVSIDDNYSSGNRKMVKEAADAFVKMAQAAKNEGYTIRAISTYRTYIYQRDLYNRYASNDGAEKADTYSARPGHSEHQTGLAVDVDNANLSYTSFGDTNEFGWMKANAYKYGFILRYTEENEWITGYNNEPWHYRYVGEEIAKYIQENPMTYEEYYVRFLDK